MPPFSRSRSLTRQLLLILSFYSSSKICFKAIEISSLFNIGIGTVAFFYMHKCELSYMCPDHDIKLHPHRVKLYQIGCVESDLVLAKA